MIAHKARSFAVVVEFWEPFLLLVVYGRKNHIMKKGGKRHEA
jgi:hypothetical protein